MTDFGLSARNSSETIALRGVDVSSRIAGLLAETTVTQKYRNDTDANLELAYTFPLPVGGVLLSFAARVGERRYEGTVIPRKEAEVKYEEAISEGNSAFRLQEIRSGIDSATLGNVMAGEAVEITLTYGETLAWNGSSIRYRLPTALAPRYGEPDGMQPWQRPVSSSGSIRHWLNIRAMTCWKNRSSSGSKRQPLPIPPIHCWWSASGNFWTHCGVMTAVPDTTFRHF